MEKRGLALRPNGLPSAFLVVCTTLLSALPQIPTLWEEGVLGLLTLVGPLETGRMEKEDAHECPQTRLPGKQG